MHMDGIRAGLLPRAGVESRMIATRISRGPRIPGIWPRRFVGRGQGPLDFAEARMVVSLIHHRPRPRSYEAGGILLRSVRLNFGVGVVALPFSEEGDDTRGSHRLAHPWILVPGRGSCGYPAT